MEICIIGSGNVATHVSQALVSAGHTISAIFSHHIEHAKHLAEKWVFPYIPTTYKSYQNQMLISS